MDRATTRAPAERPVPLLDLGNVLFDVHFDRALAFWARAAGRDPAELAARFAMDAAYAAHETGRLPWPEYRRALADRLGLELPDALWRAGWCRVVGEARAGVEDRIRRLQARGPVHAFSNTNPLHLELLHGRFGPALGRFGRVFTSCELGLRKPEPAAFRAVARALDLPPERLVFLDDTAQNVEGARAAGLDARHVPDAAAVQSTLDALLESAP